MSRNEQEVSFGVAVGYLRLGRLEDALAELFELERRRGHSRHVTCLAASLLEKLERFDELVTYSRTVLVAGKWRDDVAWIAYVRACRRLGLENGAFLSSLALGRCAQNSLLIVQCAKLLLERGETRSAEQVLGMLRDRHPRIFEHVKWDFDLSAQIHCMLERER